MKSLLKKNSLSLSLTLSLLLLPCVVAMADDDINDTRPSDFVQNGNAGTKPVNGEGTKDNPYQIATYANLVWFVDEVYKGGEKTEICAQLTENIRYDSQYSWFGIGANGKAYSGVFDGNMHTISGLVYENTTYTGPFGFISVMGNGGVVKNLILTDCNFNCPSQKGLGVVCGKSTGGIISHCSVQNNTMTNNSVSGMTGMICGQITSGTITHCYSTKNNVGVNSSDFGTIAGVGDGLILKRCVAMVQNGSTNLPLVGNRPSVSPDNCFGNVSADRFASGEMTWVLSDDEAENQKIWRQNLKEFHPGEGESDELPVFTADHEEVYRYGEENKSLEKGKFTTCWYLKPITLNNVTAYIAKGVNQNNVTLEQVNSTEKNIPYVLYSENGGTYSLPICYFNKKAFLEEKRVDNNLMVGQVKGQDIVRKEDCVRYVLQTQNGVQALYRVGATKVTAANFKCYMEQKVNPQANARTSLGFSFGEPTGIEEIQDNQGQTEQPVNIMGQRVGNATRGIYIINGKKFLAR